MGSDSVDLDPSVERVNEFEDERTGEDEDLTRDTTFTTEIEELTRVTHTLTQYTHTTHPGVCIVNGVWVSS